MIKKRKKYKWVGVNFKPAIEKLKLCPAPITEILTKVKRRTMKTKSKHNTVGELCSKAISRAWGNMTARERTAVDHIKWSWRTFTVPEMEKAEVLLKKIINKKGNI